MSISGTGVLLNPISSRHEARIMSISSARLAALTQQPQHTHQEHHGHSAWKPHITESTSIIGTESAPCMLRNLADHNHNLRSISIIGTRLSARPKLRIMSFMGSTLAQLDHHTCSAGIVGSWALSERFTRSATTRHSEPPPHQACLLLIRHSKITRIMSISYQLHKACCLSRSTIATRQASRASHLAT